MRVPRPGRGSLRPPAASRCCARKLAARSFRGELAERSSDWRRGAAGSPEPRTRYEHDRARVRRMAEPLPRPESVQARRQARMRGRIRSAPQTRMSTSLRTGRRSTRGAATEYEEMA